MEVRLVLGVNGGPGLVTAAEIPASAFALRPAAALSSVSPDDVQAIRGLANVNHFAAALNLTRAATLGVAVAVGCANKEPVSNKSSILRHSVARESGEVLAMTSNITLA